MTLDLTEEDRRLLVRALDTYYDLERGCWTRTYDEHSKAAATAATELRKKILKAGKANNKQGEA